MSREEYLEFCAARAEGRPARRKPESIRPFDGVLAKRVELELEAARATDDQARSALRRAG